MAGNTLVQAGGILRVAVGGAARVGLLGESCCCGECWIPADFNLYSKLKLTFAGTQIDPTCYANTLGSFERPLPTPFTSSIYVPSRTLAGPALQWGVFGPSVAQQSFYSLPGCGGFFGQTNGATVVIQLGKILGTNGTVIYPFGHVVTVYSTGLDGNIAYLFVHDGPTCIPNVMSNQLTSFGIGVHHGLFADGSPQGVAHNSGIGGTLKLQRIT